MTLIVGSVWGGRVSFVADRRISRGLSTTADSIDEEAVKILAVYCRDSLFAVTYTGVAASRTTWPDHEIASCLAFKPVSAAFLQPGSFLLNRPLHELLQNLAFNLPIRLRERPGALVAGLTLAVGGWHLKPRISPFFCEIYLNSSSLRVGGVMSIKWYTAAKHLRSFPHGLWLQSWGDEDYQFASALQALGARNGLSHNDVERFIVQAIVERGNRTKTVGQQCIALQLDPRDSAGHIQYTYYPCENAQDPHSLLSGWVLVPSSIHSPTRSTTFGCNYSACGSYVESGYSDPKAGLVVRTRLPIAWVRHGGPGVISVQAQQRSAPPR